VTAEPEDGPPSLVLQARRRIVQAYSDQRIRFVLVGGFNTAFGAGVFVTLHFTIEPAIGYIAILIITWILAVLEAFVLYRYVVFRVRGKVLLDLARFSLVYLSSFLANLAALPLLVEVANLPVLLAQTATFPLIVAVSYVGHHRFSFRRRLRPDDPRYAALARRSRPHAPI
jgi:putative flippase GtrA